MESVYSDRTETLAVSAREGNGEAFETLVALYGPMIQKHIAPYRARFSYDELYAEACEALLDAVGHWKAAGGAHFSRYADLCVGNRLKSLYRTRAQATDVAYEDASAEDLEGHLIRRENAHRILLAIRQIASELEYRVFSYYFHGYTPREIAQHLGMQTKDVTNAKARLYAKLRKEAARFSEFL
ncbi:MAG: sigma-70 family RNA polymerase sigma factor [Clostridia bacterium]|nr:sigma-70 family RNA polymerase sigma factor [Clostridia bacterium]